MCISYYGTQKDIGIKCDKILKGKGIDVHKSTQEGFYQEYPEVYESVEASGFRWYGEMDMKIINSGDHSNLGKEVYTTCYVQVNICQKLLFLHQLKHSMTTDYSLFMKIVSSEYLQDLLCAQIVVFVSF